MKKFILDVSTWRCGSDHNQQPDCIHTLGLGFVELLNNEGYQCCLGQWLSQTGVPDEILLGVATPSGVAAVMAGEDHRMEIDPMLVRIDHGKPRGTNFAVKAININDDESTTIEEKIELLKELLESKGIEMKVINGERYGV